MESKKLIGKNIAKIIKSIWLNNIMPVSKNMEGITAVDNLGDCHYRFHFADPKDITEKMIATSVAKGWQLEEIQLERLSLDEIFARLSGKR